jgi:mRNA interferase MazF
MNPEDIDKTLRLEVWSKRKVRTHLAVRGKLYFEEREIWWSCLGENIGNEINGKHDVFERPVIILKKLSADILMAIPVTTKLRSGSWFYAFNVEGQPRRAVLAQIRVISTKRLIRRMGAMSMEDFAGLQKALINLIKTEPPVCTRGSSDPSAGHLRG